MKMTQDTLAALGACGDYMITFRREFPESNERYADGVDMTADVCEAQHNNFDWAWAADVILTPESNEEWAKLTRTRNKGMSDIKKAQDEARAAHDAAIKAWQSKYERPYNYPTGGETREAQDEWNTLQRAWSTVEVEFEAQRSKLRATSFGKLAEDELNLSERYHNAVNAGVSRRYERRREQLAQVERDLENVRYSARQATQYVQRYQRELETLNQRVPALEERLVRERAAFGAFEVEHARIEAERLTGEAQRAAERLAGEAQRAAERVAQTAKEAQDRIAEVERKVDEAAQAVAALDAKKADAEAAADDTPASE